MISLIEPNCSVKAGSATFRSPWRRTVDRQALSPGSGKQNVVAGEDINQLLPGVQGDVGHSGDTRASSQVGYAWTQPVHPGDGGFLHRRWARTNPMGSQPSHTEKISKQQQRQPKCRGAGNHQAVTTDQPVRPASPKRAGGHPQGQTQHAGDHPCRQPGPRENSASR